VVRDRPRGPRAHYAAAGAHSALGAGGPWRRIDVGNSRVVVIFSGRKQAFASPPQRIIISTPATDPQKWLRGQGRGNHRVTNFSKGVCATADVGISVSEQNTGRDING
jgi:hypothetical protein